MWTCSHQDYQSNWSEYNQLDLHYHWKNIVFHMCTANVAKNSFCSFSMKLMWFLYDLGNQPNYRRDPKAERYLCYMQTE